jgi:hypothetical protein
MDTLKVTQILLEKFEKANEGSRFSAEQGIAVLQAYATIAQAEEMQRIATHLGNIHQALITPDTNGEPTTVADTLKRIAGALNSIGQAQAESPIGRWAVVDGLRQRID